MASFTDKRKQQLGISSIGQKIREGRVNFLPDPTKYVHGPPHIDCLTYKWARGKMMGLIGASGVGKTELVMEIFEFILTNNPNPNSICVFVTLENTVGEIAERWVERVGTDSPLSDKLYVVSNYQEDGSSRHMSVKSLTEEVERIKSVLNADVICTAVDHLHVVEKRENEDLNKVCHNLKNSAVNLDTFIILLSQTQMANNTGDIPLDQNSSHSCSQFSWICDWILTVHAPLKRLNDIPHMNILAWQYAKIRNKHKNDGVKVSINQLLSYDMDTRRLEPLSEDQKVEFPHLYSQVLELRDAEEKTKFAQYNLGKKRTITNEQKVFKN